jgi:YD repeat-containing protein
MRVIDAAGRERWLRTNALRELAEVVEPAAYGGGLSAPGNNVTTYTYNALHLLTGVVQGPNQQERDFAYDGLGRMVAEYLPEKSATLNDNGIYVGQGGRWSDVFTYDDRSNLTSHTDARGVMTLYDYGNDPLNRLQHVFYGPPADTSSRVVPVGPTTYTYMTDGDITRVYQIWMQQEGDDRFGLQTYGYDPLGRLTSKTLSSMPFPVVINYDYDGLNRLTT